MVLCKSRTAVSPTDKSTRQRDIAVLLLVYFGSIKMLQKQHYNSELQWRNRTVSPRQT